MQPAFLTDRRRDILLLIFSIVGILGLIGRGIYPIITGIVSSGPASNGELTSSILGALSMIFCAALLLPMLVYSLRRLKGQEIRPAKLPPVKLWQVAGLASVWLVSIVLASILDSLFDFGWIIAVPFFLLGISIPIGVFVWIAIGGFPTGSRRRLWSVFGIGMAGSTVVAMLLEYLVVGIGVLVAGMVAAVNPEWRAVIIQLKDLITSARDIQVLLTELSPYLTNPLVLLLILAFASVLAPMIEEALKPAAVWLVGKRLRSPAEGFALGALCGAGFALLEGILAASGATGMIGFGLAARAASSLMHITVSGLMGWAIASVRLEKRYGRLALTYLLSVALHGLWNGAALLAVYGALRFTLQSATPDLLGMLSVLVGIGMLGLMLVSILIFLPLVNRRLRPVPAAQNDTPYGGDIIAPPQS
jgi:RsiW-degrading membrane proteinase PrsW (M82 family)